MNIWKSGLLGGKKRKGPLWNKWIWVNKILCFNSTKNWNYAKYKFQGLECHIYVVVGTFLVLATFRHFLLLLELKTKLIKFCTQFWIKPLKFLPSICTSLLLCSRQVQRNRLRFFKKFKRQCCDLFAIINKSICYNQNIIFKDWFIF